MFRVHAVDGSTAEVALQVQTRIMKTKLELKGGRSNRTGRVCVHVCMCVCVCVWGGGGGGGGGNETF